MPASGSVMQEKKQKESEMRGCVAAWLRGCVAAWLRGCVAAWLRKSLRLLADEKQTYCLSG
ncbi:hypothetical protein [Pantoea ananatis]|uniref:hypothetical protein n=1 Tax=Pantoea ananas TaxID=553 RepID=UPI003CEC6F37